MPAVTPTAPAALARIMTDWIVAALERTGYAGIALLMFLENLFPPIPSELIMPFAGFTAARGRLDLIPVVIAGTAGSTAGAAFWYAVGRWVGRDRLRAWAGRRGRWVALSVPEIDRAIAWFERRCGTAIFLGRLVPTVRTLISVPAGIASMAPGAFLLYTSLGTAVWSALLATAGYLLEERFAAVGTYLNPVSAIVAGAIAAWYIVRVVTFDSRVGAR